MGCVQDSSLSEADAHDLHLHGRDSGGDVSCGREVGRKRYDNQPCRIGSCDPAYAAVDYREQLMIMLTVKERRPTRRLYIIRAAAVGTGACLVGLPAGF